MRLSRVSVDDTSGVPVPMRYLSILTVTCAVIMSSFDNGMVNIALPAIARQLDVTPASSIWVISAFQIALAASLLPLSSLGEIYGYRRVYLCGLALFTTASGLISISGDIHQIIALRIAQGLSAAGILSVNIALIRFIYPRKHLGKGISINAFVAATAVTAGAPVGSLILKFFNWHGLFAVNVPFGIAALILAVFAIPNTPMATRRFDIVAGLLCSAAFGLMLFTLNGIGQGHSLQALGIEALLVVAMVLCYVWRDRKAAAPFFPVDLFRSPLFRVSVLTSVCSFAAQMLAMLVLPYYMEALGFHDPAEIGFLIAPWPATIIVTAIVLSRLVERYTAAQLCTMGLLIMAAGLASLASLRPGVQPALIIICMIICGAGFGLFQSPNNWALISSAPPSRSGAATGMLGSARLLGQSIGGASVALILTMYELHRAPFVAILAAVAISTLAAIVSVLRAIPRPQEAPAPMNVMTKPTLTSDPQSVFKDVLFKIEAPVFREALKDQYVIHDLMPDRAPPSRDVLSSARVLVTTGFYGASANEIGTMPNLSLICCIGTGYENVDLSAAMERGIMVTHGAGTNATAVADHAVAMLLCSMRNLHLFDSVARQDLWRGNLGPRPMPTGKRAGVVGLGGIGRRIAQRLQAFDMEVSYNSRSKRDDVPWTYYPTVRELAENVDCLLIAAPGGKSTFHMINDEVIDALGPKGFLVNVSRGSLVDTEALVRALRANRIAGAALDVFEEEPHIPESLRTLQNVLLTPHVAAHAPEVQSVAAQLLLKNINMFLRDKTVATPVPEMMQMAG